MALLLPRERRESWTGLVKGLSAYYRSPGRLAVLRRRFESAFRRPGLDPATFATELGILAIQGFEDMNEQARDIMIKDKFIAGQRQCALRRQLDGFAQDTPIGEIVDSCRVWESHSDPELIADGNHDSDAEHQSGDFRTRERLKPLVNVQSDIVATEEQDPMVGIGEDHSVIELLVNQLLQPTQYKILSEDRDNRPTAAGPVCFSCGCEGHGINRCSQMDAAFPFLPSGWSVNMYNGPYRATQMGNTSTDSPGNEEWSGRGGGGGVQPPGPSKIKVPLTLGGGGGFRRTKQQNPPWRMPAGRNKGRHWAADSQEFPALGRPPSTVGNTKESNCSTGPSAADMDRLPKGSSTPVVRKSDRGMRPAQEMWPTPHKDRIERTRGVMKTIATSLSALAEIFIPRKTLRKLSTSSVPTDNELDQSLSRTGPGKIENPHDSI